MPTISVIIPVYNIKKYVKKCVNSVISQSYEDIEIILVDDGSFDGSEKICDEFTHIDDRIKVYHKSNGGLSSARNFGIDHCNGKYLFFIDGDDWLASNALEIMLNQIQRTKAEIAIGNLVLVGENGQVLNDKGLTNRMEILEGRQILKTIYQPNACNKLFETSLFENIRFPIGRLYEDSFIYHHLLSKTNKVVLIGETTYYYLFRKGSIMNSAFTVHNLDIIDAVLDRVIWLDSIDEKSEANKNRLFLYSRIAAAWTYRKKLSKEEKKILDDKFIIYKSEVKNMLEDSDISLKQKIRIIIMAQFPNLHTIIWGLKMPVNLGE